MAQTRRFDVIVVGGGPAGSAMGWNLATRGIDVAVVERAEFPREKVCGDFVEPAGLRILEKMGCIEALSLHERLPITKNRVYFGPRLPYHGEIPYYDGAHGMPPHGYIIPRDQLDTVLLANAEAAGATVFQGTMARGLERKDGMNVLTARQGKDEISLEAPVIVGADGVQSMVAKTHDLRHTDRRHIGASQRVYLDNLDIEEGEATIWFDEDHVPGYGWMFPMTGGRANMGIGLLTETCDRFDMSVQQCFREAVERLRWRHPGCKNARIASKPLGGAVHMYGGVKRNHFEGGILVGDAGGFVDPMTGEGITQGMESSTLGAETIAAALDRGSFTAEDFAPYEEDFRDYFDPAMRYLVFLAQILRNRHFRESVFLATRQGFERAQQDRSFAEISGCSFGGLNVQPLAMSGQIMWGLAEHFTRGGIEAVRSLITRRGITASGAMADLLAWQRGWRASTSDDLAWHLSWLSDIGKAMTKLGPSFLMEENPRLRGPFAFLEARR
ncbi:NAD(P)/FAD-dependent oxidoreductase [Erythrobacter sp. HKB08]|uniref:NAD(P)/FAD-dependent oxidoreductase n=1 Tax=Erythrobacter sp. HKB08 TaxID=2502843 RepID=UPI001008BCFE|nr:NAD(P)/FAD-dependent oxidoreductase [Erythrobacter sp. HKB08]